MAILMECSMDLTISFVMVMVTGLVMDQNSRINLVMVSELVMDLVMALVMVMALGFHPEKMRDQDLGGEMAAGSGAGFTIN
jgi:hypothetical protein